MIRKEIEQYIGQTVKVQYINLAGKTNEQIMILETISLKKAHFLLYDAEEDIEVSIRFENMIKIEYNLE
jgi:hypothetical protein